MIVFSIRYASKLYIVFQGAHKVFGMLISLGEAVAYVMGGMFGDLRQLMLGLRTSLSCA